MIYQFQVVYWYVSGGIAMYCMCVLLLVCVRLFSLCIGNAIKCPVMGQLLSSFAQ